MSIFNAQTKIIEIIEHDSNLLPVISRFGIKLGFGDLTVKQACSEHHVDENFFLTIINVYHSDTYFPEKKFLNFSIDDIIQYLVKAHQYYISFILPEIDRLLNVLLKSKDPQQDIFLLLEKLYSDFKTEFFNHIEYEELKIFPLIRASGSHKKPESSDIDFISIHDKLDDKFIDIKNLLIKYLPPIGDNDQYNALAIAILRFEKDLKDHARIEDRILYPQIKNDFLTVS